MEEDVLSDVVPSNIVSRQVKLGLVDYSQAQYLSRASQESEGGESEYDDEAADEMEVDDRYDVEARPANEGRAASRGAANLGGNRGGKRSHSEEDGDVGHAKSGKGDGLPDERMEDS